MSLISTIAREAVVNKDFLNQAINQYDSDKKEFSETKLEQVLDIFEQAIASKEDITILYGFNKNTEKGDFRVETGNKIYKVPSEIVKLLGEDQLFTHTVEEGMAEEFCPGFVCGDVTVLTPKK